MRRGHKSRLRCTRIVYTWLSTRGPLSVAREQAYVTLLSQAKESKSCMPTEAALAPLDLEEGAAYDAVLAEIK